MCHPLRQFPRLALLPLLLAGCGALPPAANSPVHAPSAAPAGSSATLALLETTDLHANVLSYDYYKLQAEPSIGLERTAALIAQARAEFPNTLLLDNGDTIQGTALADYQALVKPLACDQTLAIYKAMNLLKVDGGGIGNHEFNYGLAFLSQVTGNQFDVDSVDAAKPRCAGPQFPQVLANVYSVKSGKPLFAPYHIIAKQITATGPDGQPVTSTVKVGIISFAPPTIMAWDRRWLEGRVYTQGVRETAEKFIPEMRARGAELVVAISHGGLDDSPYSPTMENGNYYLSQVPGVDAMLIGHSHQLFPNATSTVPQFNLPGVDKVKGTVNGVPTVMANLWGKHLGVIGLRLRHDGWQWVVDKAQTTVEARGIQNADRSYVAPDAAIARLVAEEHAATIAYVQTPVGATDFRMSTYFADVGDVSAIEVVNQAQSGYLAAYVKANLPQYAHLPVLSMSSPFKSGSAGVSDYTDVKAGNVALNNAADLYLYPNALYGVKMNGAELKAWLEQSARRFNTIDVNKTEPQELVNTAHPSYNFDAITSADVRYQIDITQPPGRRIQGLTYQGKPVDSSQEFLIATNNYRASGGGNFPSLDGSKTVVASPDNNRELLIAYVTQEKHLTRAKNGSARSWRFARAATKGPVVFHSAPNVIELAKAAGIANVTQLKADDGAGKGFALYQLDLSK
ncbi:bifunctional 2',3'-cyclic-nucleotide 2'-phosphodiesterase/3'-nucleotidase [Janthinobacterium sp. SUN118]|uniref:bifunctional 2',3'-cyclic-nucleotide 2'-phosphodiesterase/3'-nucleotidase n=1 Tax=Janthinobacterium sp. SUN118 TaxID=3004100 RepID=UPI0025B16945|nr:bifunctional 2',3'-cyclic-nucleotide 2'-phosphodiesterase/3'-nucleotidase [Janthinobacterium sp. SUN118]MDN2709713.1 bifunctional 2',3'-cyclic-nucleotide 2'-phosphodiesterase/3'-nucleotidase [Janthinobacterium sp. SUN118]